MKCRDARDMINAYLDNNLDPMNDSLILEHINSCPKCRDELDFLIKYRRLVKTVRPVTPPDNFLSELHERIELEKDRNPANRLILRGKYFINNFRFPLEAAGVLAAAAIVLVLYKPFYTEKPPTVTSEYKTESAFVKPAAEKNSDMIEDEKAVHIASDKTVTLSRKYVQGRHPVKDNLPASKAADDTISVKQDYDAASGSIMKESPAVESENRAFKEEQKIYSTESSADKEISMAKKEAAKSAFTDAEKIFWEFDADVVRKNLSQSNRVFYKIKVNPDRYNSLIKRLKRDFAVEEKITKKSASIYEIELFLKKKKNKN